MSDNGSKKKLDRYIGGYTNANDVQAAPGPDGDPQLSALDQFLHGYVLKLSTSDAVLDIGSGMGVGAYAMLRVWKDDTRRPWYYAADRQTEIDALRLPLAIHNHSRKYLVGSLLDAPRPPDLRNVRIVLFRNVMHHLHISKTAEILVTFRHFAESGATIYLQDMEFLAEGERVNTGWQPEILSRLLQQLGFVCSAVQEKSKSGTPWFTIILENQTGAPTLNIAQASNLVLKAREEQKNLRTQELSDLDETDHSVPQYILLTDEIASLQLQIARYSNEVGMPSDRSEIAGIPIKAFAHSGLDYIEEVASKTAASGLRAILSSKRLIDLATLIGSTHSRLWLEGYSQRVLFSQPEIRAALSEAIKRGVDVRILIVDPNSPAAEARGMTAAYSSYAELRDDIEETINGFQKFSEEIDQSSDKSYGGLSLRLCKAAISSSFFIADGMCVCSLYSANLTGGDGAAFVFHAGGPHLSNYFQALLREFQGSWATSVVPSRKAT